MFWSRRRRVLLGSAWLLAIATSWASAADLEAVTERLRTARERHSEMRDMYVVYVAKTEVVTAIQTLEQERSNVEAGVRQFKIQIDSFPARRNNLQQAVYDEWLMARSRLTELDHQLNGLRSQMKAIDEQALALTVRNTKRPVPLNRRDIQVVYPNVQRECYEAFRMLREAADELAKEENLTRDKVIGQAMSQLGSPEEMESHYGPTREFLADFRQYCRGRRPFDTQKSRPSSGMKRPSKRGQAARAK